MRLTKKLLSFLNRVFDKTPDQFLALRLSYVTGNMRWKVADAVLTTVVTDGPGQSLTINLGDYRLGELINFLAAQTGYQVLYGDTSELSLLSARILLDGDGNIAASNGDHLYGYQSPLWAYMEAMAYELGAAEYQVKQMLLQMSTRTANNEWLDELGGYYGIPRLALEVDASYGPRIITEVLRPRANNVAMEMAIKDFTGQAAKVTDVVLYGAASPIYDGTASHNGVYLYNASAKPIYGLFDVEYGYDLINGGDITMFAQQVRDLINRLRDAGTHLRALSLIGGSALEDAFTAPTDGGALQLTVGAMLSDALTGPSEAMRMTGTLASMSDVASAPGDSMGIGIAYDYRYNGIRSYNGIIAHQGGQTLNESL